MAPRFFIHKPLSLVTTILALSLISQMPEWKTLQDRDGNTYSIDKNWKIYTDAKLYEDYKPVSIEGLDYYINLAAELVRSHHPVKGIRIYQSILAMPNDNHLIYKNQIKAAQAINYLKNRHGPRFQGYYESAQPFIYRQNNIITLLSPSLLYGIKIKFPVTIIRKKIREKINYQYYGMLLGISPGKNNSSYEMLLAIDTEVFPSHIQNVDSYKNDWRYNILKDKFDRKTISHDDNRFLNEISHSNSKNGFTGFELITINKNRAYFVRIITAANNFMNNKSSMLTIINDFTVVK